jgi:8-amino-7-oxononanoate synthase
MSKLQQRLDHALKLRASKNLSRTVNPIDGGNTPSITFKNRSFTNFSSNDYLGLASDKELTRAWQAGLDKFGNGSGASPLVTGYSSAHQQLQESLCEWLGFESAVLFNSGFSANQALLFSLLEKGDLLLQDKLNHASLMEAGTLSPATMKRFKHNDLLHLNKLLEDDALVVTEGVFSMDGDLSPLKEMSNLIDQKGWLVVDDAHGVGVLGAHGKGSCDHAGIKPNVLVVTFGKAFGLSGAAILCDADLASYLTQFARHHVYSTAMPPAQAYALSHATSMIEKQQWRRDKLAELSNHFDKRFSQLEGYCSTITPIKPFILGDTSRAIKVADTLKRQGHWVTAIRPPTVPNGTARLRLTLTANHTEAQLDQLVQSLQYALQEK